MSATQVESRTGALPAAWGTRTAEARTTLVVAIAIAVPFLVAGALTDGFLTIANAKAVLASMSIVGIVAVGMTAIMISGALASLALGTTACVAAITFIYFLKLGLVPALAITLAISVGVSALQGAIIGGFGANPIVLTIAAAALLEGVTVAFTGGNQISPVNTSYEFLTAAPLGISLSVYVLIVFAIVVELVMRYTRVGWTMHLVGENRAAARAAGLPVGFSVCMAFAVAGIACALAGMLLGAQNRSASFLLEGTLTFDAIGAALVGGTAVNGGRGSVLLAALGALVIAVISNLLLLNDFSTGVQVLVKGGLVTLAVLVVHVRQTRRREGVA